jgi:urease subunit beta
VTTPVGGYVLAADPIKINPRRARQRLAVRNTGDRPIQVGSHFHFFEVNRALEFDRGMAFGQRLDIAAGTAMRFEPGDQREVTLVPFGGKVRLHGFNDLVDGWAPLHGTYRPRASEAFRRAEEFGFMSDGAAESGRGEHHDAKRSRR